MWRIDGIAQAGLSPADRGLAYGDGVFRTLRVAQGRPLFWHRHYRRLVADAARLGLSCPESAVWLTDIMALVADCGDGIIKCMLTRGAAGRGYALPTQAAVSRIVLWSESVAYPPTFAQHGIALRLCSLRLGRQPLLAGIKHLNRLENVLARAECSDPDIAEGLLLDGDGMVVEGIMSNIFWRIGERWYTPMLDQCGVAGATREWVIEQLHTMDCRVTEVHAPLSSFLQCDEAFVCNSLIGVWPVRAFQEQRWENFPTIQRLQTLLERGLSCTEKDC